MTLIISTILLALMCTSCAKSEMAIAEKSSSELALSSEVAISSESTSSEVSSDVSSKERPLMSASLEVTTSIPTSSEKAKVEIKPKVSSKVHVSSQLTKKTESRPASSKLVSSAAPKAESVATSTFGELMDEAAVDAIIAEGIEYANNKGMTWYEDFSIEESGYYNPAFSGEGAEIFRRDLSYNIDQLYDIIINDPYYYEGGKIAYKIVKGQFITGYWYGYVLY